MNDKNNNEPAAEDKTVFLVAIIDRRKKEAVISAISDLGVHFINTVYGKGAFKCDIFQSAFGLVPEKNKVIIFTAATYNKASSVLEILNKKFNFDKPDTGIAFIIPLNRIVC